MRWIGSSKINILRLFTVLLCPRSFALKFSAFHISQDLTLTYFPISIDISSYVWAFSFLQIFAILLHLLCLCCCLYYTLPSTSAYQNSTSSPNHKCIFQHVLSDIPLFISPPKIDIICLPLTQGFLNSSL